MKTAYEQGEERGGRLACHRLDAAISQDREGLNVPGHFANRQRDVPRATYRVQLHAGFTFDDAVEIVPYLNRLGISHLYVSPILQARSGSTHGYDVTDHTRLNSELGGAAGFERLCAVLQRHDMGLIADIVPNHLGIMGSDNQWWLDVLENGPAARAAGNFDIDWRPNRMALHDRLLVPVLGAPYGEALENGEIRLVFDPAQGEFWLRYNDHRFPIDPREYPRIFAGAAIPAVDDLTRADFDSLMTAFGRLPSRHETADEAREERYRDKEAHKRSLARLVEREADMRIYIEEAVTRLNGVVGEPESFDALDALHESQPYRLAFWRVAQDEINYRRFFDVNSLAVLRMNDPRVFAETHELILSLVAQGKIQGLRIDHSDGLYDPQRYFERLRTAVAQACPSRQCFIVTEKILGSQEKLPETWPLAGTTGYDFSAQSTAWLVDATSEAAMSRAYREFTGERASFEDIAYDSKRLIMHIALAPEVEALATQLDRIARLDRHTADFTRSTLRQAIIEAIACFPVYRTYITASGMTAEDRYLIERAMSAARRRSTLATEKSVLEFLRNVLLGSVSRNVSAAVRAAMLEFVMKFQQVTGPVAAKGIEDTALYRFNRLACLNDVGSDPVRYSLSSQALHQENLARAQRWPHTLLATSTHDSKRSEDVRARIAVLSEMPQQWRRQLRRWHRLNRSLRSSLEIGIAPDANDEYLLYQTLLGTWQADGDPQVWLSRLKEYAVKAVREAKRITSWINPESEYEDTVQKFLDQLLSAARRKTFRAELRQLGATIDFFGRWNVCSQLVLKLTAPGVPDFYQGCEVQALNLVDPDNRQPVDFQTIDAQLRELIECSSQNHPAGPPAHMAAGGTPDPKLWITYRLLQLRRELPDLFAERGAYMPLTVTGRFQEHALAFARTDEAHCVVVIVTRWFMRLMGGSLAPPLGQAWADTAMSMPADLPRTSWTDALSGRSMTAPQCGQGWPLAQILQAWPYAVLRAEG